MWLYFMCLTINVPNNKYEKLITSETAFCVARSWKYHRYFEEKKKKMLATGQNGTWNLVTFFYVTLYIKMDGAFLRVFNRDKSALLIIFPPTWTTANAREK
jgi:hypothetical protein